MGSSLEASDVNATSKDHDEFLVLIEVHQRLLFKVCWAYTFTTHDRDDLLQEIVGRLWSAFAKYDRTRRFSTWMYRVALNVAIDCCRRKSRAKESESLDNADEVASPIDATKQEQLRELHELLERQSEADRAILLLYLEGNSHRDIGEVLGISESNVGTRMSRLKKSLRQSANSYNKDNK
jgi:RNA polymerase sigma-70 factor (ECF subfamily)